MEQHSCPVSTEQFSRTMKTNGTPVLTVSIRRPSFPNSGKFCRMERYFSRMAQQWQRRWETALYQKACQAHADHPPDLPISPWQAMMDYRITLWEPPLISLRIEVKEQGPAALPLSLHIGEVWDCASGFPCSLHSFLPSNKGRWKHSLITQLQEQTKQRLNSGEHLLHPDCTFLVKQFFDPTRFYLTDHEIVVFYPLYVLGSYSEGLPAFTVPRQDSGK